jgi:hypothetical protein
MTLYEFIVCWLDLNLLYFIYRTRLYRFQSK